MRKHCLQTLVSLCATFVWLFLAPSIGVADTLPPLEVHTHLFSNGLSLYHVKVDHATKFKLSATVWVGSANEEKEVNGGISHLLEHILFHQPDMRESEFNAQVESRGGSSNATTSGDYTYYHVTLPSPHLELGHAWLHKVLFHDRLVTDRLEEEKEIVNRENGWAAPTWWHHLTTLVDPEYLKLPGYWERTFELPEYDQSAGGTYKVASRLTAAQLEVHYQSYYYPENMVLLYAGPHEFDAVVAALDRSFGAIRPTGREPQRSPLLESISPPPVYSHELPGLGSSAEHRIGLGYQFAGVRFSQRLELSLYRHVMRELLEERFRYEEGASYSVSTSHGLYRGAGYLTFWLEASPDRYWTLLESVKPLVWGNLAESLSREDYERYKMSWIKALAPRREIGSVHSLIWGAVYRHPFHRPTPEQTDFVGALRTLSYEEFLKRTRLWQKHSAPVLQLSMPVVPIRHANLLLFVFAVVVGFRLGRACLRRPFPQESIQLMTHIPYGILGSVQFGVFYAAALFFLNHLYWVWSYAAMSFQHNNSLGMVSPYLDEIVFGLLVGFGIVIAGSVMPRKVLVTDGAVVVKMQSPLFFRIPLSDIREVESVNAWTAWKKIVSLSALPLYPWFWRGFLIHRKSGLSLVLRLKEASQFKRCLAQHVEHVPTLAFNAKDDAVKAETECVSIGKAAREHLR